MSAKTDWRGRALAHWSGAAVAVVVLVTPLQGGASPHQLYKTSLLQAFVFSSLALAMVVGSRARWAWPRHWATAVLGALFLVGALSVFWAEIPGYALKQLIGWGAAATVGLAAFQLQREADVNLLLRWLFAAGAFVALLGCLQHLSGSDIVPQAKPPAATFANRNIAMQIVVPTWLLGAWLMLREQGQGGMGFHVYAVGIALAIAFASYTQTRAAWLAMLVQLIVFASLLAAYASRRDGVRLRVPRGPVIVAVLLAAVLVNLGPEGFDPLLGRVEQRALSIVEVAAGSGAGGSFERFVIWRSTLEIIAAHPVFGIGLGNFPAVHPAFAVGATINVSHAHDDYLQLAAELGVPAALAALGLLLWLVWLGVRQLFLDPEPDLLLGAVLVALAGLAVDAVFSFPMQLIGPQLLVAILLALLLRQRCESRGGEIGTLVLPVPARVLTATVSVVVLGVVANWYLTFGEFERFLERRRPTEPVDLSTWVEHPIFMRFAKTAAQKEQTSNPRKAEMIARSYYRTRDDNVIVNNTLALTLIRLKRFDEADEIIERTRPLEPRGYYRSWENEQMLAAAMNDGARLSRILERMREEPIEALTVQVGTLGNLAVTAYLIGRPDDALELLRANLGRHPADVDSHVRLLTILSESGRRRELDAHLDALGEFPLSAATRSELRARFQ